MANADECVSEDTLVPRGLSSAEVLEIWETRRGATMTRRALALLTASLPDTDSSRIASLPIGVRDQLLLRLRSACFGGRLECLCHCPKCEETAEFSTAIGDLLVSENAQTQYENAIEVDGREIKVRPVNSHDLLGLEGRQSEDRVIGLLRRCTSGLDQPLSLSKDVIDQLSETLGKLDPGADIKFSLSCPACNHLWSSTFDIASYLWAEIEMAARRLLPEIHALARSYGWSEKEILALSPTRRRSYLELIGAY